MESERDSNDEMEIDDEVKDTQSQKDKEDIDENNNNNYKKNSNNKTAKFSLLEHLSTSKYNDDTDKEIIFYNYIPKDENFKIAKTNYFDIIEKKEQKIKAQIRKNVKYFLSIDKNPLSIVPNKNNIDLKRNIAPRLMQLQRQTEIAILEMLTESIKKGDKDVNISKAAEQQMRRDLEEDEIENSLDDNNA